MFGGAKFQRGFFVVAESDFEAANFGLAKTIKELDFIRKFFSRCFHAFPVIHIAENRQNLAAHPGEPRPGQGRAVKIFCQPLQSFPGSDIAAMDHNFNRIFSHELQKFIQSCQIVMSGK